MSDSNILVMKFGRNEIPNRRWNRRGGCVYCGAPHESRDHVIPKALYTDEQRSALQLQVVSSCIDCNSKKKSITDAFLRDYLVVDIASGSHEQAREIFGNEFMEALKNKHVTIVTEESLTQGFYAPKLNDDGTLYEMAWAVTIDDKPLIEAIDWITKGVHWVVFGNRADPASVKSWLIPLEDRRQHVQDAFYRGLNQGFWKQGEVYVCSFAEIGDGRVYWQHVFYDSVLFVSMSSPVTDATSPVAHP